MMYQIPVDYSDHTFQTETEPRSVKSRCHYKLTWMKIHLTGKDGVPGVTMVMLWEAETEDFSDIAHFCFNFFVSQFRSCQRSCRHQF